MLSLEFNTWRPFFLEKKAEFLLPHTIVTFLMPLWIDQWPWDDEAYLNSWSFMLLWISCSDFRLVLLQVPKFFVPVQIFWASPKIWLHLVPLQNLLCRHKNQFYWMQIIFLSGTKCLWLAQYVNKFLVWHKKFRPAQNILRPVKGQGKRPILSNLHKLFWNSKHKFCKIWISEEVL